VNRPLRPLLLCLVLVGAALAAGLPGAPAVAANGPLDNVMPIDQVKPGAHGEVYTIIEGDKVEKLDLEVIGILPNLMGPKQDIILIKLVGERAKEVGVAAGMSGSPVYIDGKLVGALSLKFGIFTKEALGGVTPIAQMLEADASDAPAAAEPQRAGATGTGAGGWPAGMGSPTASAAWNGTPVAEGFQSGGAAPEVAAAMRQYPLPGTAAAQAGVPSGAYLEPIDTPLLFSGFAKEAVDRFAPQFASYGMAAVEGGTTVARPDDADLKPGEMAGIVLATGDLSIQAGCSVTAIVDGHVFLCGHPVFSFGKMALPMSRGRVLTTMVSSLASTKIMNSGGVIGTINYDRVSAVTGRLGAAPQMVPVTLDLVTPVRSKTLHFEVAENPKLTPLLVAIATYNGLVGSPAYSDGTTFHLTGRVEVEGHSAVELDNMFAPNDFGVPDGLFVALMVQQLFARVYMNPYESPQVKGVTLHVESIPERRQGYIENAWSDRSEAAPGEQVRIKVLVRPYRGAPYLQEIPVTIPMTARGTTLRVMVSDADTLNRTSNSLAFSPFARLAGLDQLIHVLNRERRNNRLYVALLQPAPTLLVEDKELPNTPLSQIEVLGPGRTIGGPTLLRESLAGEWSVPMNQVITGQQSLQIKVK
jgi:SpoIVB peptidase S55